MLFYLKTLIWLGLALLTLASGFIALVNGTRDPLVANIFWGAFAVGAVISYWLRNWFINGLGKRVPTARDKMLTDFLQKNGFNLTHVLDGSVSILFDTAARRMAFFYSDNIVEHPYDYIRGWEQHWTERGTKTYNHKFNVRLNNLNRPILTITPRCGFASGSRAAADKWDATLDLILSQK